MEGGGVAKLNGLETETAKPISPETDLVSFITLILPTDPFYPLDPTLCPGL